MAENNFQCPFRIGSGYDVHAIAAGLPMWLGGVMLDCDYGFVAHSDGDVAIHALCDALLGSVALGDIGHFFPDTSDEWKGIDSKLLLKKVVSLVTEKGWKIGNVDITIVLEKPKVAPYISRMKNILSDIMDISEDCISIKAGTNEKLGFVGRSEGCQVWATTLIYRQ
jgi:2-C-methyl-D-erythritol 2,4-cyclodiphosphate synthase